ncbi:MAG TPA: tetratricopeptide repeat protein, partial [Casimicrobiaceae bacterium]|nr:tetratricopeptide repeat protein [Casimicrobiaceae bacterium]
HNIGYCDVELGRFDDAQARLQRALAMFRERGHARGETMVLASLGVLARRRGDLEQAEAFGRASLALAERIGNTLAVADTLDDLGQVLAQRGALDDAVALFDRALAMARKLGQVHLQCFVLLHRARAQAARAGAAGAAQSLRDALALAGEHDFPTGRLMGLLGAAGLRAMAGDADALPAAARWCSAAIAAADGNVDVLGAVPAEVPGACIEAAAAPATHVALDEATAFVAAQCDGATPVAAG